MSNVAFRTSFSSPELKTFSDFKKNTESLDKKLTTEEKKPTKSFMELLKEGVADVDKSSKVADKMADDIATGKSENLHEAMLAMTTAELGFNFMVQVRNKALEAYQEISRMQV